MMRIAVVDEGLPYPPVTGKRIRTFNLMSRLAKIHDITYYAHINASPEDMATATQKLREVGITPVLINHRVPQDRGLRFGLRLVRNLFSPEPYSVQRHRSPAMQSAVIRDLTKYELWHCEWTPYAHLFRGLEVSRLVIIAHNIESQIWQRYFESENALHRKWYIKHQWKKFQTFERSAFSRATQTVCVSDGDAQLAVRDFGAHHVTVVENGVDTRRFQPTRSPRSPGDLLILGSLFWRPNIEGIRSFLNTVFPRVLQAEPNARLSIVGRYPPRWLTDFARQHPQVAVHGNVPDVVPHLARAGMLVVPLTMGGGSRLKILEAAAAGLPVVSTRIGAEGLEFVDGVHITLADGMEDLSQKILWAVRNYGHCIQRSIAARRLAVEKYDWDLLAAKLDRVWRDDGQGCDVDDSRQLRPASVLSAPI